MKQICTKCGVEKDLEEDFYDGRRQCKKCLSAYARKWNRENKDRIKVDKKRALEIQKRYRARHGDRIAAREVAKNALAKGLLEKPYCCESCGKERVLEMHHEDYSKPLDVEFICKRCHSLRHRKYEGDK